MNFNIKQYSDIPLLRYKIDDEILSKYNITDEMMENVGVTFSLFNIDTEQYHIANNPGDCLYNDFVESVFDTKYTLVYKFSTYETSLVGNYIGEFKLSFLDDECEQITLPNSGYIHIFIGNSITKVDFI